MSVLTKMTLGLFFLVSALISSASARGDNAKYSVTGIHARLFFHGTGKIGTADLLDGNEHHLWNTIIGEGGAGAPSSATWVLVELTGPTFLQAPGKLEVKATANKKVLLNQTLSFSRYSFDGKNLVLPFLVYDTGCGSLEIAATLKEVPASKLKGATLKRSVPFDCGE